MHPAPTLESDLHCVQEKPMLHRGKFHMGHALCVQLIKSHLLLLASQLGVAQLC